MSMMGDPGMNPTRRWTTGHFCLKRHDAGEIRGDRERAIEIRISCRSAIDRKKLVARRPVGGPIIATNT